MAGCGFGQRILFLRIIIEVIETGEVVGLLIVRATLYLFKHHLPITPFNAKEVVTDAHLIDRQSGTIYPLSKEKETTIGRIDPVTGIQPDIDFTNVDSKRSISRRHAKIRREDDGGYVVVEDAGTLNGTFVNGERLITGKPVPAKGGDVLRFGAVECQFVLEA